MSKGAGTAFLEVAAEMFHRGSIPWHGEVDPHDLPLQPLFGSPVCGRVPVTPFMRGVMRNIFMRDRIWGFSPSAPNVPAQLRSQRGNGRRVLHDFASWTENIFLLEYQARHTDPYAMLDKDTYPYFELLCRDRRQVLSHDVRTVCPQCSSDSTVNHHTDKPLELEIPEFRCPVPTDVVVAHEAAYQEEIHVTCERRSSSGSARQRGIVCGGRATKRYAECCVVCIGYLVFGEVIHILTICSRNLLATALLPSKFVVFHCPDLVSNLTEKNLFIAESTRLCGRELHLTAVVCWDGTPFGHADEHNTVAFVRKAVTGGCFPIGASSKSPDFPITSTFPNRANGALIRRSYRESQQLRHCPFMRRWFLCDTTKDAAVPYVPSQPDPDGFGGVLPSSFDMIRRKMTVRELVYEFEVEGFPLAN